MRIVDLREVTAPIASSIANAYIDFSKMTLSLVAVVTDVKRDGRTVIGYGFNSNGRYGQGAFANPAKRFAPRLREAKPEALLNEAGDNLDPDRVWATLMKNEKPGGHGERSVAVGAIDMAIWDATAKTRTAEAAVSFACCRALTSAPPIRASSSMRRAATIIPAGGIEQLRAEMRSYLDRGYTVVKMKIGNSIAEDRPRIEGVLKELGGKAQLAVDANGRLTLEDAIGYARMLRDYPLFWYEEAGDPLDFALQAALAEFYPGPMATGENLFFTRMPAVSCAAWRHAPRPRLAAVRLRAVLRIV